jgi:hypothetical protein
MTSLVHGRHGKTQKQDPLGHRQLPSRASSRVWAINFRLFVSRCVLLIRRGRPQLSESALDGRWFFAENSLTLGVVDALASHPEEVLSTLLASKRVSSFHLF